MMAVSAAGNQVARGPRGRSGFTLVEVLVVLAILVILFAMLFAPMIASLDMVTVGQAKVTMQTSARNVLGEMRREISNAMYIYPVPGAQYLGADDIAGTNYASDPEVFYPNYSQVAFVSPETEGGSIVEPLAPRMRDGQILVTVLSVELLDPNEDYSRSNPFVLVRKEGTGYQQFWNDTGTISWWDFDPAETLVRNVLSPRGSFDIPVSRSICTECGDVTAGYIAECAGGCDGEIIYVHSNVRFNPERVVGETLEASANRTLFHARHKAWAGLHNRGHLEINDVLPDDPNSDPLMQLGASALDPRITLVNPADRTDVVRDTWQDVENDPLDPRGTEIVATWNSDRGIVQIGSANGRWVNVPDPDLSITAGDSHPLQVQPEWPDPAITPTDPDEYNDQGIRTSSPRNWDLIPVYPSFSTPQPGDPVMPIAYRIDQTRL
ncbi:MAG: prepilin-type N-terminal cleavage/methylation domain-containing protein [Armatimonadota bacterium]